MKSAMFLALILLCCPFAFGVTILVPGDYPTIQQAIDAASPGDIVLVSEGTYLENITITSGITVRSASGPENTVIDGNSQSYAVQFSSAGKDTVLDGFTVTNCSATGLYEGHAVDCGGNAPTICNNIITDNHFTFSNGAGVFTSGSSPDIYNNVIVNNSAGLSGGGIYHEGFFGNPLIRNNLIYGNTAGSGGAIAVTSHTSGQIVNNTLFNNTATNQGGALHVSHGAAVIMVNTILWGNTAPDGKEIAITGALEPGHLTLSYCNVEGGKSSIYTQYGYYNWGDGMITLNPLFKDAASNDLHITFASPCNDAGDRTASHITQVDIDGDPRVVDSNGDAIMEIDIGADEFLTLHADAETFSASMGGTVNYALDIGAENGNRAYLIFGTMSGKSPGIPLPGGYVTLPINWDVFTGIIVNNLGPPLFTGFLGKLDANGQASAQMWLPGLDPFMAGVTMYFAFSMNKPFNKVSNPIGVLIVD